MKNRGLAAVGAGALVLAALLAAGASQIPGEAGYAGAGPNLLPWAVSTGMAICGIALLVSAWRARGDVVPAPDFPPRWRATGWISLGLLLNAALIEHAGFIVSCALLFALASRGFRIGADQQPAWRLLATDFAIGAAVSAPVFWLFTKGLGLTLPDIFGNGWI